MSHSTAGHSTSGTPPRSTVIVCTRDRPLPLTRLLASTRDHVPCSDLLVVDSASRDSRTREVALAAGVGYLRVDRPGLSIARNAGIHAVDTEVVVFTDDDCVVADDWTAPLLRWFDDPRIGVVTGDMIDEKASPDPHRPTAARRVSRTVEGLDLGHGANMAFRRAAVVDVGGFDDLLGAGTPLAGAEDLDMFCRLLNAGWLGVREPRSTVVHAHTREGAEYTRLIEGYARGSGAALVKMLRIDRTVGAQMTGVLLRRLARRVVVGATSGPDREAVRAHVGGLVAGMAAGARLTVRDGTYVGPDRAGADREESAWA